MGWYEHRNVLTAIRAFVVARRKSDVCSAANDAAAQWKAYRDLLRYGGKKARFPAGKPMGLDQNGEVVHNSQDMADQELNHFAKIQAGKIVTAGDLAHKYNQDSQSRIGFVSCALIV